MLLSDKTQLVGERAYVRVYDGTTSASQSTRGKAEENMMLHSVLAAITLFARRFQKLCPSQNYFNMTFSRVEVNNDYELYSISHSQSAQLPFVLWSSG